jgi:carboxymethylenebutenolidase
MKAAGKQYEPVIYDGAGHGFMRAGEDPANAVPGNKTAREQGFARLVKLLHGMKSAPMASAASTNATSASKSATPAVQCHETAANAHAASM